MTWVGKDEINRTCHFKLDKLPAFTFCKSLIIALIPASLHGFYLYVRRVSLVGGRLVSSLVFKVEGGRISHIKEANGYYINLGS